MSILFRFGWFFDKVLKKGKHHVMATCTFVPVVTGAIVNPLYSHEVLLFYPADLTSRS